MPNAATHGFSSHLPEALPTNGHVKDRNRRARAWFARRLSADRFLEDHPLHEPTLRRLEIVDDRHCGYMAVSRSRDGELRLHVHPEAVDAAPRVFRGVLRHQLRHIERRHLDDRHLFRVEQPYLMRLAMEAGANEGIADPLPGSPHRWEDYVELGFTSGQSTWKRYRLLIAAHDAEELEAHHLIRLDCGCGDELEPGPIVPTEDRGPDRLRLVARRGGRRTPQGRRSVRAIRGIWGVVRSAFPTPRRGRGKRGRAGWRRRSA